MRIFLVLIILIACTTLAAQQFPVQWKVNAELVSHGQYIIHINGKVAKGWHVYANTDIELGLEPVSIIWDNENIVKDENEKQVDKVGEFYLDYKDPVFNNKLLNVYGDEINLQEPVKINGSVPNSFTLTIKCFTSNDKEFQPIEEVKTVELPGGSVTSTDNLQLPTIDPAKPVNDCGDDQSKNKGLLAIFLLGFLGGLFALITPCVFPMIPVTVSFFMGKSKNKQSAVKNGMLYGIFIFLIYLLASSPFHLITGIDKNIFNSIATNAGVNVVFFLIFIAFALSFFGLFEITLPGRIATKADSKSSITNVSGIFFMALTLAIVSFSCTGVILGVLLANVAANGPWALTMGMTGFGLALALPFALFAIFPNLLKSLPKSGNWLDTVRKVLAFVELALAFKFLSNADLVEHWGLLKREVFIALWILIALGLAFYLLGFFEKKKIVVTNLQNAARLRPQKPKLSRFRIALGVLILVFALYLIPGVTKSKYANLKLLSGFPPPLSYSIYGKNNVHGKGLEPAVVNDYDKALQLAREQNKPLLIDFTGWACVNCRKMEEQVWTKSKVQQVINENYILVSLYVDDRKKLPGEQQFKYKTTSGEEKEVRSLGDKWAGFQAENFNQVTQPLYVVLSPDEKLLNHPVGYTPSANDYEAWLKCGIEAFKKQTLAKK
jgi:thiol:disulfide interchange protein